MCQNAKNQTSKASLKSLADAIDNQGDRNGTGLFILPDPVNGEWDLQTVVVPDITYEECVKRVIFVLASNGFTLVWGMSRPSKLWPRRVLENLAAETKIVLTLACVVTLIICYSPW